MLAWLKRRLDRSRTARKFYGSIVTQARRPVFYAAWDMPDDPRGRFEMVVLHLVLAVRRLAREGASGQRLARALNERFITDMDDVMREMTFGDLAVPREIKQVTAALLDRHKAYAAALAMPDDAHLQTTLATQLGYLGAGSAIDIAALARYMRRAAAMLDAELGADVLAGGITWPEPDGASGKED